ncbi:MAG TPA: AraC family transcriptional regulator [Rhizobacter sp.]|nr:AraC family transcriptional regulator [Rhizobacter sp.]
MDLQFASETRSRTASRLPARVAHPFGRMHLVRDGFLYAGLVAGVKSQRHSTLIYLSLDGSEFTVESGGERHRAAAMLVGPGVHKCLQGGAAPLMCLDIFPTHRSYRVFAHAHPAIQPWPREHFCSIVDELHAFHDGSMGLSAADRLHGQLVALAEERMPPLKPIDARVREVMRLLRESHHRSMEELAEAVCLSKDWLVHLFQREAGISLRKFEQALKLQAAATYVNRGVSMTEVAANAGFADSAHFSKLWKQHFGFPPRRLFVGTDLITVDPLPWPSCIQR